jgi:hypothetical protein
MTNKETSPRNNDEPESLLYCSNCGTGMIQGWVWISGSRSGSLMWQEGEQAPRNSFAWSIRGGTSVMQSDMFNKSLKQAYYCKKCNHLRINDIQI